MRTDSTNIASSALSQLRTHIAREYGDNYLPAEPRIFKTKSSLAQEAHEAIRPTKIELNSQALGLVGDEAEVYELIWQRTVACQMKEALVEQTSVVIRGLNKSSQPYDFRAAGSVLKFDGYLKVFGS